MSETSRSAAVRAGRGFAADELALLLRVGGSLAASLELPAVLQAAIEGAVDALGMDMGVIYLLKDGELYLRAGIPPLPPEMPDEHRHAVLHDHPHLERCLGELRPMVIRDSRETDLSPAERVVVESADLRSAIFSPLAVSGQALGVMIVHTVGRVRPFDDEDIDLCWALSHQISLAVANAQLYEEAQRRADEIRAAYDETLAGWSRALEMRDEETRGHTDRVADLTVDLARRVGVSERDIPHVRRGALLHDIGKMVVPDAILHKPGPLTDGEWAVMKRHPEDGRDFLAMIEYLRPALDIPYCHHERWDGSGYPRGLGGDEIPLSARVFAVADVFDALTSDRPYRAAWKRDEAIAHIRDGAGSHFDREVVGAFLDSSWRLTD